jgi:hypothetical protein
LRAAGNNTAARNDIPRQRVDCSCGSALARDSSNALAEPGLSLRPSVALLGLLARDRAVPATARVLRAGGIRSQFGKFMPRAKVFRAVAERVARTVVLRWKRPGH